MPSRIRFLPLALLVLLAGCGALPQPFAGNPGATALRLSQPPPARLVVEPPARPLLPDAQAGRFATVMAETLVARELPAVPAHAGETETPEWRLKTTAQFRNGHVVPMYTVQDPQGKTQGAAEGQPIDPAAWAQGTPATFQQAADDVAPAIVALLTGIHSAQLASDPNSLVNRPARVFVADLTGAPGDGNHSLALQMRRQLPQ
jgi:hypothetical protein